MKHSLLLAILFLFSGFVCAGQDGSDNKNPKMPKVKYTISVKNGDTLYSLVPEVVGLRPPFNTPTTKTSNVRANRTAGYGGNYMDLSHIPESYSVDKSKDVGEIPISQNSANGTLGYSIPISAYQAPNGMNPSVQIVYNSMSGNGVAGYGWQIGGLSAITVTNATTYFDGAPAAPKAGDIAPAFSLDGMRLIDLQTGSGNIKNYQTEQGNIKVVYQYIPTAYAGVFLKTFTVYYPNGNIATYGNSLNLTQQTVFPLLKTTDVVGNVINYSYNISNNTYYVSEISYAGREGSNPINNYAKIAFGYEDRSDVTPVYIAGICMKQDKRLKELKTYFNGQLLRTYTLSYTNAESSLLQQIDCSSNGKSLNPLKFYYGENNQISGFQRGNVILTEYFANASTKDLVLSKGKFDPNSLQDGLVSYPYFNTYGLLVTKRNWLGSVVGYQYGSTYSADQDLLVYDLSTGLSCPAKLKTESGFQLLTAMDVDGDGKDELVKMNTSDINSSSERITYKVYDLVTSLGSTYPSLRYSFDTYYGGVVEWGGLYSPSAKKILTGDFLGNGKQTILTITYNKNIRNSSVQSWATLVDFDSKCKSVLYDQACFSLSPDDRLFVTDFDGDGKADLCQISSSDTKVYTFNSTGGLDLIATYSGLNANTFIGNREMLLGDINGDGKIDIVVSPIKGCTVPAYDTDCGECDYCIFREGDHCRNPIHVDSYYVPGGTDWQIFYSTGAATGFNAQGVSSASYEENTKLVLQDMNRDGRADLVVNSDNVVSFYPSVNGYFSSSPAPQTISVTSGSRFTTGNVMTAWQMSQLFSIYDYTLEPITFTRNLQKEQLLTGVVSSSGVVNKHQYCTLQNNYGNYDKGTACSYPYRNLTGNLYLHARADSYLSGNQIASTSSAYTKGVIDLRGKGFLGFEQVKTYDNIRVATATQTFDPANFGVLKSTDAPTASATYNYNVSIASNKIASVTLASKTENSKLTGTSVSSSYAYDTYGNPTQITDSYSNGYIFTENTYSNLTGTPYKLGVVTKQKVTSFWMGQTLTKTQYVPVYDSSTGLPIVVVNSNNDNGVSSTIYTYQNGLITKESVTNYSSSTPLATSYTYDGLGRLQRKTNPIGTYTDYAYNTKGQVASVTDHKGNATSYVYDDWGSKTQTSYPDGVTETAALSWASAPSGALTQATVTTTGKPTAQSFADALGREIRKGEQRFDGSWLYTDQVYDNRGRLQKVSLPFKSGAPSQWNTYGYDDYDRLLSLSYASGKTDSYSYNGLSVTATIDGVAKTTTKNTKGQVVSVSDPAGTITYNLRPDGQPSSIVAPGGITTSFEYDGYGRQTKLIDPSAGTRQFGYDAAGNLNSETDANGKVTSTTYDAYNRVSNKDVAGELTTSYVYNPDGQLSSVSSNNGTGQSYTYDGLMRVATATETAPDGKYLQKGYTYANGTVSAITYTTPGGTIATENYLYSNGTMAEIKLNGSASVWKLTAENNMGLVTGATTGNLTRSYGFDAYGLPTARTVKYGSATLQDFGYNFDPATGNLNWRKDNTRALQENFTYDNLNRLKTFGGVTMTYDATGNITDHSAVGQFVYHNTAKPYALTGVTPYGSAIPLRNQDVTYNSLQRPATIAENGYLATITYDAGDDRAKMTLAKYGATQLTRYYIGGQYETETGTAGSKEKLYLGGDAYSAAAVYVKENGGSWNIYYICRDYLGSITHIVNSAGSLTQELSYDPWGRLRNPATQVAYTPDMEPALFLSRGYTGHEHLTQFGLINMNARLYDAALGRFLSPDPYVQAPDFSQNFNRYSYCVNNPLKYTDENGKWFGLDDLIGAVVGGVINWATNGCKFSWEGLSYFGAGAVAGWMTVNLPGSATLINAGLSAANNTLSQGFNNGWSNIDFGKVCDSGLMGAMTSYAGGKLGTGFIGKKLDKAIDIQSPLLKQLIINEGTNISTGAVFGGVAALNAGGDFWDGAWDGAKMGMVTGAISGLGAAAQYSIAHQVNMLTGNPTKITVNHNGNTVDLSSSVERIQNGESYPHKNDGSVFENRPPKGQEYPLLPQKPEGYYREYVHPTPGVSGPGAQRIVTGKGGEMWYTPDHYRTFIPIKW